MAVKPRFAKNKNSDATLLNWRKIIPAPVIVIKAEEPLFADRAVALLRKQLLAKDPGTEVTLLEAATYEPGQLGVAVSPSLFSESRFVYIPQVEQASTAMVADILNYQKNTEPEVTLVLRHNGGNGARKLLTDLQAAQIPFYIAPKLNNDSERIKCVLDEVRAAGGRIDNDAAALLVAALRSELPEILAVANQLVGDYPGEIITSEIIEEYQAGKKEVDGYEVVQAAIDGDLAKALTDLRHALACGITGPALTGAMAFKLRQLAKVSTIPRRPAADMGMPRFIIDKTRASLRTWTEAALREAIKACATADAEVKGESRDPVYALEKLMITVATRARNL
ncbi:DNA polymerase III subunit delta [Gleimia sp. 6138-11-ORH1]|uniref:DNA polymerase III subunit delta n=1 Tax=Gleimia sp. 6138-11-ORH1 TaxID=2973937 RepID=UPI002166F439|nr:DNA polymerase III subunit delta [Gleimia sp. 6138-11-ORH1]MCS4484167.1 DNA polymerase III subunit delta [Gleimia sp. 6138-11-ORH1]